MNNSKRIAIINTLYFIVLLSSVLLVSIGSIVAGSYLYLLIVLTFVITVTNFYAAYLDKKKSKSVNSGLIIGGISGITTIIPLISLIFLIVSIIILFNKKE